ncbi:MAG TPA: hypothetical protein ENJ95_18330 [Bacteroidetes bacterium]|nr:hypothetical protein [Bacteroidota bacterium]
MKNLIFIFLAFSFTTFTSCSKDDGGSGSGDCSLEAKIDGADWCGSANFNVLDLGIAGTITSIGAGNTDMEAVSLQFMDKTTGTYDLAGKLASYTENGTAYQSTSGTLTISKFEGDKISGTFSFEAADLNGNTVSVTGGKFDNLKKQ